MTATIYNRQAFLRAASDADWSCVDFVLGFDAPTIASRHAAESAAIACDSRIPANCIGYVADLTNRQSTIAVMTDRIAMLSRFVEFAG